ncbi:MAG: hypothetical protein ACOYXA_13985 [Bacteroidota bacterium]
MTIPRIFLRISIVAALVVSYSGDEQVQNTFLYLRTNAYYGVVNGHPFIFDVMRSNKYYDIENLTDHSQLLINNEPLSTNLFKPTKPGIFLVQAKHGQWTSDVLRIEVREDVFYDSISIPIIFHVMPGGALSEEEAVSCIEKLNRGFNG